MVMMEERQSLMNSLQDKVVIVTGGSSGIGRSAALQFATLGARVLITGRHPERLAEAAEDHLNIEAIVADVSRTEDAFRTIASVIERWGRRDYAVSRNQRGTCARHFCGQCFRPIASGEGSSTLSAKGQGIDHQHIEYLWF
jgi:NAD(P)-dependent dehydrogenase (short-subunit alcohol dehydrogenase family)